MLETATLRVLAEAAEIGLPEAVTVPAAAYDPFFRPVLKRRVRAAVDAAGARARDGAPPDHVLRLAFLGLHPGGPKAIDPNDVRAVEQAFETLAAEYLPTRAPREERIGGAYRAGAIERDPAAVIMATPKRKRRFWPVTSAIAFAITASAVVASAVFALPYLLPSPIARFRGTPMGTAMGDPLTDFVARGRQGGGDAREKILTPKVRAQIGAPAYDAMAQAIDQVPSASSSPAATTDEAMATLFTKVNEADEALVRANVPVLLHGYGQGQPGHRAIWLTSWFVERRDALDLGGQSVKIAWGRRLDSLNLTDTTIYKADAEAWAVLAIENVEEEFVQTLLSPIAVGAPLGPDSFDEGDKSASADLARASTPLVAAEVMKASGLAKADADGLRRAIARRNEAAVGLAKLGYAVEPSSRIELSAARIRGLTRAREANPRDRPLLDELLHMNERMGIYRTAVAPAIAELVRIEEEEFAARVVSDRRYEKTDAPRLGRAGASHRARAVAAAELGLLAHLQSSPRLALWRAGHSLLTDRAEDVVGLILEALFRELALLPATDEASFTVDDSFVRALKTAVELPPERVRAAAAKVYQDVFGEPVPPLVRTTVP